MLVQDPRRTLEGIGSSSEVVALNYLEEVREDGHGEGVWVLPRGQRLQLAVLALLHEADEGVLVAGAAVLPELAVLHAGNGGKCFRKAWNDCYGDILEDGREGGDDEPAREAGVLGDVDVGDAVEAEVVAPLGELVPRGAEGAARGTPGREADKKNASF